MARRWRPPNPPQRRSHLHCHFCGGTGISGDPSDPGRRARCASCGSIIRVDRNGREEIRVWGARAEEVQAVTQGLAADAAIRREEATKRRDAARLRSPWFSGLFYLTAVVVIVSLLLVVSRVAPWWAFPVVVVGGVLLVSVVGAFQMRQDDRLSERGFVRLMGNVLRRLPLVIARSPKGAPCEPDQDPVGGPPGE